MHMLQGKRIVAFVVGGVTRSEMRVAHKLSAKLGREILIGSTSCDTPTTFLKSLQVAPPSFVCNREHPSVLFAGVQCNMHVMQVTPPFCVCKREHLSVLLAGVQCNMHVTQVLTTS